MVDTEYPEHATPLDRNETEGLLLTHITSRSELDRWEQDNINEALAWLEKHPPKNILSESFMKRLHKKMFGNVWKWAGTFRRTDKNIGVPWYLISVELKKLCDDVAYWLENQIFPEDETAARFHHRLVSVHLFPNGNGRHARLMTDILLENQIGKPPFSWGSANLKAADMDREKYIDALIAADQNDYEPLIRFVRS